MAERVNERVGHALHDNSHLVGLLVEVTDEAMLREATGIAEVQGWRPLPSHAHFARHVRAEALRRGMADLASAAFLAYRETVGRQPGSV
ncbi:hypothetical protein [Streptomyces rugosispiralis]|uniref:Uncharacterized protein n=1 Tax=Streptomyces rugosispiralis TaxID=2967341 RepID=A0ABT1UYC0_9ACTN|nr:hypothetical protein [Streptomyces rugosispiralis]MCQ8190120.1 hypothetical protein [Streptomyces rugosispiralis]